MAWQGSTRRRRLPPDWPKIRARVLERDGRRCYVCHGPADQVDHVKAGDDHRPANLAAICDDCHRVKTAREAAAARAAQPQRRRPAERHPGLA